MALSAVSGVLYADSDGECLQALCQQNPSDGPVSLDRYPVHVSAVAAIISDGAMHGAAVVPEGYRSDFPVKSAGKLRPDGMRPEILQQRPTLLGAHAFEANRVMVVDEKRFSFGVGVGPDDRMSSLHLSCRLHVNGDLVALRSEEHTSELQSRVDISYA